jgi:small subunit ribosomal protein S8
MSHTDPLADLLTRVRNATRISQDVTSMPHSKLKEAVAQVFKEQGYVTDVTVAGEGVRKRLVITLKYAASGQSVLTDAQRVSRPGRRVYRRHDDIKQVRAGLGVAVISTPRGVMADSSARQKKVGGEILCAVW